MSNDEVNIQKTTLMPERRAIYEQVATLVAGNKAVDVVAALADNLGQAAAFVSDTPEAAEKLLHDLLPDMVRDIRNNWQIIVEAKAQGHCSGHA